MHINAVFSAHGVVYMKYTKGNFFRFSISVLGVGSIWALSACAGFFGGEEMDRSAEVLSVPGTVKIASSCGGYAKVKDFKSDKKPGEKVDYSAKLEIPKFDKMWFAAADSMYSEAFPYTANRLNPWIVDSDFSAEFDKSPSQDAVYQGAGRNGQYALLKLSGGGYLALLPITAGESMAWLYADKDNILRIKASNFGTEKLCGDFPLLVWARDKNPYRAVRRAWEIAANMPDLKGKMKLVSQKEYPEPFKYLGWCSWEQYHKDIDSNLLCEAVDKIHSSGVPIRWVLVDDGFQTQEKLRLKSFSPDPKKFPDGWEPLIKKRNPDGVKWFGLWHCYYGLWNGISPENDLGGLNKSLVKISDGVLMPGKSADDAEAFYGAFIGSVADSGFDFVKIDVQTGFIRHFKNQPNAVRANTWCSRALEDACGERLDGIINCMAHNGATFFNSSESAVIRCSVDYFKGKPNTAKSHLYQSYQNSIWLSHVFYPDHDMFHSSDAASARDMAISKALSAAPVYLSDAPEDFVKELIMRLCFEDGEILRPLAPAVPLPDSIFSKPLSNRKHSYRVIAPLENGCAAVMLHNLCQYPDKNPKFSNGMSLTTPELQVNSDSPIPQNSQISPADYIYAGSMMPEETNFEIPQEGLAYYDWYAKKGGKLDREIKFVLERPLEGKLLLMAPISNGWAVFGASEKFLSPAAVDFVKCGKSACELEIRDGGEFVIYLADGRPASGSTSFESLGGGLWRGTAPKGKFLIEKTM